MPTTTAAAKLVNPGHRIPEKLNLKIDRLWSQRRARGTRESKQAFVTQILEVGLKVVRETG